MILLTILFPLFFIFLVIAAIGLVIDAVLHPIRTIKSIVGAFILFIIIGFILLF